MSTSILYHAFNLKGIEFQSADYLGKCHYVLGRKQALLKLLLHRLQCMDCQKIWWPKLPFMIGKHRYTRSFALTDDDKQVLKGSRYLLLRNYELI
ncbi:MAG: hypothetical protein ACQES8_03555 [Thermodesulfobacteriota bacterium]